MTTPNALTDVGAQIGTVWNDAPIDQPMLNQGFITDMDNALKQKVSGLYVTDEKGGGNPRRVPAYFGRPPKQEREQTFPYIIINLLSMERAAYREQRSSDIFIPYTPAGYTVPVVGASPGATPAPDQTLLYTDDAPIPYDFTWQVASHARFIEHDREIIFALMQDDRLPTRFGWLQVNDTIRYLDLLEGPTTADGYDENRKRIFRKTWLVRATAEFFQRDLQAPLPYSKVTIAINPLNDGEALQ